jgi:hypothetical protein
MNYETLLGFRGSPTRVTLVVADLKVVTAGELNFLLQRFAAAFLRWQY